MQIRKSRDENRLPKSGMDPDFDGGEHPCPNAGSSRAPTKPPSPSIETPRDIPYPGRLSLLVDATDREHGLCDVHERVPAPGPGLTLLYPEWLPGNHGPTGPLDKLAGLKISAAGAPLAWSRDLANAFAFHVEVPAGISAIDLSFQFLSAVSPPRAHHDDAGHAEPAMEHGGALSCGLLLCATSRSHRASGCHQDSQGPPPWKPDPRLEMSPPSSR